MKEGIELSLSRRGGGEMAKFAWRWRSGVGTKESGRETPGCHAVLAVVI